MNLLKRLRDAYPEKPPVFWVWGACVLVGFLVAALAIWLSNSVDSRAVKITVFLTIATVVMTGFVSGILYMIWQVQNLRGKK